MFFMFLSYIYIQKKYFSFSTIDPIGEILNQEFGSKTIKLHHSKCMLLVQKVLGPWFKKELLEDLHQSNTPFSLHVDDTTDCSVEKICAFSTRYYSHRFKTIKDTFLKLESITYTTADASFEVLQKVIKNLDLDTTQFVGLSTDTTNSMVGANHSLKTLAKDAYKNLTHVHCPPHMIDLAAKDAFKSLPDVIEWMIRASYNWFAHSTIRQKNYQETLELIGFDKIQDLLDLDEEENETGTNNKRKPALKLMSPSDTRWLMIADCSERIMLQVILFLNLEFGIC